MFAERSMDQLENKIKGAIYGLLLGDAVGVPYEFQVGDQLPSLENIDINPLPTFSRSYPDVPVGTWSDGGAQSLCLIDSLLNCKKLDIQDYMQRISNWYQFGYLAVDGVVFNVSQQTQEAIHKFLLGTDVMCIADPQEYFKGNDALTRCLPLALWHKGTDDALIEDAYLQTHLTHTRLRVKVCCALYCLWARYILKNLDIAAAWKKAVQVLRTHYLKCPLDAEQLEHFIKPDVMVRGHGGRDIVDCLHSARFALQHNDYKKTIQSVISLGHDTDTTACVAGGIAGLYYGYDHLPQDWLDQLRAKNVIERLSTRFVDVINDSSLTP